MVNDPNIPKTIGPLKTLIAYLVRNPINVSKHLDLVSGTVKLISRDKDLDSMELQKKADLFKHVALAYSIADQPNV